MTALVVNHRSLGYRELRWLLVALALHAVLLSLPLPERPPVSLGETAKLMIRMVGPEPVASPEPVTMEVEPPPATPAQAELPEISSPPLDRVAPREATPTPETIDEEPGSGVTALGLIGLRESIGERVPLSERPASTPQRLGVPGKFQRPDNWQPGAGAEALAPFDNVFNGKTVPAKAEVLDRWLAEDGSHNVIVETPGGLRLCGRAQSWDPTRPLVEPVMRWQVCGGDFARPFKFKPREPLDRDFIVPVAKDATTP